MGSRLNLQRKLEDLLGTRNVYFQPPPNLKMNFPCIVYERARLNTDFADNNPYKIDKVYYVTYIDTNPDSDMPLKLASMSMMADTHYIWTFAKWPNASHYVFVPLTSI